MATAVERSTPELVTDLAIVGAGAAGLFCALSAAHEGARVVLISATPLAQTASYWAQGGLAAAVGPGDSAERHLEDTERAGRGAVRRSAAEVLVAEAPRAPARPAGARGALRRRPHGRTRARPRGRPLGTPGRSRRRQRHRPADPATAIRARRRATAPDRARGGKRARAGPTAGGRTVRRRPLPRRAPSASARGCPRHRRRRSALVPHDQPTRLLRHRHAPRPRRRGSAR